MQFCRHSRIGKSRIGKHMAVALRLAITLSLPTTSVCALARDDLTSRKDVQVAVRAIAFPAPPPSGSIPVAIIYAPENPVSSADAQALRNWLEAEGRTGNMEVQPILLRITDLSQLTGYRIAFITRGMESTYEKISNAASHNNVLTISTDTNCILNAYCSMTVVSEPKVQITISHLATQAAHVEFSTAFRMLVNEK